MWRGFNRRTFHPQWISLIIKSLGCRFIYLTHLTTLPAALFFPANVYSQGTMHMYKGNQKGGWNLQSYVKCILALPFTQSIMPLSAEIVIDQAGADSISKCSQFCGILWKSNVLLVIVRNVETDFKEFILAVMHLNRSIRVDLLSSLLITISLKRAMWALRRIIFAISELNLLLTFRKTMIL